MSTEMLEAAQPSAAPWKDKNCPHVGFDDDPTSLAAYPSQRNYCHRCKPKPVELSHQTAFCLSENHTTCPILVGALEKKAKKKPVPVPADQPADPAGTLPERGKLWGLLPLVGGALAGVYSILRRLV